MLVVGCYRRVLVGSVGGVRAFEAPMGVYFDVVVSKCVGYKGGAEACYGEKIWRFSD